MLLSSFYFFFRYTVISAHKMRRLTRWRGGSKAASWHWQHPCGWGFRITYAAQMQPLIPYSAKNLSSPLKVTMLFCFHLKNTSQSCHCMPLRCRIISKISKYYIFSCINTVSMIVSHANTFLCVNLISEGSPLDSISMKDNRKEKMISKSLGSSRTLSK